MTIIKSLYHGKNKNKKGHYHRIHRSKKNRRPLHKLTSGLKKQKLLKIKIEELKNEQSSIL